MAWVACQTAEILTLFVKPFSDNHVSKEGPQWMPHNQIPSRGEHMWLSDTRSFWNMIPSANTFFSSKTLSSLSHCHALPKKSLFQAFQSTLSIPEKPLLSVVLVYLKFTPDSLQSFQDLVFARWLFANLCIAGWPLWKGSCRLGLAGLRWSV